MRAQSSGGETIAALIFWVAIISLGYKIYQFHSSGHSFGPVHVFELICPAGLNEEKDCVGKPTVGADIEITVNEKSGIVMLSILSDPNHQYIKKNFYLEGCKIAGTYDWICRDTKTMINDVIIEEEGMVRGKYYRFVSSAYPPNYFYSSVYGLEYFMIQAGLKNI